MDSEPKKSYQYVNLEVSPARYTLLKEGKKEEDRCITYPTTDHLPKGEWTFKDNPANITNLLSNVVAGDRLIVDCDNAKLRQMLPHQRDKLVSSLELEVHSITEDKANHQKTLKTRMVNSDYQS